MPARSQSSVALQTLRATAPLRATPPERGQRQASLVTGVPLLAAAAAAAAALAAFLVRVQALDLDVGLGLAAELRCSGAALGWAGGHRRLGCAGSALGSGMPGSGGIESGRPGGGGLGSGGGSGRLSSGRLGGGAACGGLQRCGLGNPGCAIGPLRWGYVYMRSPHRPLPHQPHAPGGGAPTHYVPTWPDALLRPLQRLRLGQDIADDPQLLCDENVRAHLHGRKCLRHKCLIEAQQTLYKHPRRISDGANQGRVTAQGERH